MTSPSPVAPSFVVKNGMNNCLYVSSFMPWPLSLNVMEIVLLTIELKKVIFPPSRAASIAFFIRLINTCFKLSSFPKTVDGYSAKNNEQLICRFVSSVLKRSITSMILFSTSISFRFLIFGFDKIKNSFAIKLTLSISLSIISV